MGSDITEDWVGCLILLQIVMRAVISASLSAWMANEADRSVVLALLQVAFLGKCDD